MIAKLPSPPSAPRLAVLIDGDNIPQSFRAEIDRQAVHLGNRTSCQVFADITLHSDWSKEAGMDIHHCKGKQGSNAADIALVIAALDLAYRGLAHAFLIVSNDRDFDPLLRHLTKIGCTATILRTPAKTVAKPVAKTVAEAVAKPAAQPAAKAVAKPAAKLPAQPPTQPATQPAAKKPAPKPQPRPAGDAAIVAQVKELIRTKGDASGLGIPLLNALHAKSGFVVSQTPERQWRAWLRARPEHFEIDPKGPDSRVRLVGAQDGPLVGAKA